MHIHRIWPLSLIAVLFLLTSLACSVGRFLPGSGAQVPERTVSVNPEAAAQAEEAIRQAADGGSVRLTESQFTSFLVERLNTQNSQDNQVEDITVWFEPGKVYLQVRTSEAMVPGGNTVTMAGQLSATDGQISLNLEEASVGRVNVPDSVLSLINGQVSNLLAQSQIGDIRVQSIQVDQGAIVIVRTP